MTKILDLVKNNVKKLKSVGYSEGLLVENNDLLCNLQKYEGIEMMGINEALSKIKINNYFWKLISKNQDKETEQVNEGDFNGYFIRSLKNKKVKKLIQTCLLISKNKMKQTIHNVVVAEENSEMHVINGCLSAQGVEESQHLGVTEIYVKQGATLIFTMVHNWDKKIRVRPRTVVTVEKGGTFVSNYVCVGSVGDLQMYPTCYLKGDGSSANFNSFIYAREGSYFDIGSRIVFEGEDSNGQIISKIVCDNGKVINRGALVGKARGIKAHLDCSGLILSKKGLIRAIPELEANLADVTMTHEASIGKVSQEAIEYLMSRGMTEKQAVSMMVKGFLSVSKFNLPEVVEKEIGKFNF
jgi:Fe-S cluster assembly scaffold protein SufB